MINTDLLVAESVKCIWMELSLTCFSSYAGYTILIKFIKVYDFIYHKVLATPPLWLSNNAILIGYQCLSVILSVRPILLGLATI